MLGGERVSMPILKLFQTDFLVLNDCSVQEADLRIYHTKLNHMKSARLIEGPWRISTAQRECKRSSQTVTCKIQGVTISCERSFIYESVIKSPCNMHTGNPYPSCTRQECNATVHTNKMHSHAQVIGDLKCFYFIQNNT